MLGVGVLDGVLAAVTLSLVDLLRRLGHPHDGILGYVPGIAGMHDVDDYPLARQVPGLLVYRYDSPLYFANAEDFRERALKALDDAEDTVRAHRRSGGRPHPIMWFVLNTEANVEIDITSADALDQLRNELHHRGLTFAMARVKQDLHVQLVRAGLVDRVGVNLIFPTLPTAVAAYLDWYQGTPRCAAAGGPGHHPAVGPDGTPEGPPACLTPGSTPGAQAEQHRPRGEVGIRTERFAGRAAARRVCSTSDPVSTRATSPNRAASRPRRASSTRVDNRDRSFLWTFTAQEVS